MSIQVKSYQMVKMYIPYDMMQFLSIPILTDIVCAYDGCTYDVDYDKNEVVITHSYDNSVLHYITKLIEKRLILEERNRRKSVA